MIDKQEFNNAFQYFDAETIVEVIDLFANVQPEIIKIIEKNIADHDLVQVKLNVHQLKGPCRQFYDPVSSEHAQIMEAAANIKIIKVVESLINDYPDSLKKMRQELDDGDLIQKKILPSKSIKAFLSGFTDTFSSEHAMKLEDIEKRTMADGMSEMFANLKTSSGALLDELLLMKKKLPAK